MKVGEPPEVVGAGGSVLGDGAGDGLPVRQRLLAVGQGASGFRQGGGCRSNSAS